MAENQSSGAGTPRKRPRPSPLPGVAAIDAGIELLLAEFDQTPRAVRDAGAALVVIVYRLPLESVLSLIEIAHRFDVEHRP